MRYCVDYLVKIKEKLFYFFELLPFAFFQVNVLCKFGYWKLAIKISKFITASSLRLGQLREGCEYIIW